MTERRVRFAPSPTGHLHIGGARSALFNYLYAKHVGGKMILRFEDTDQARNVDDAEGKMLRSMEWLGIHWDEGPEVGGDYGPYRSSERLDMYQPFVDKLFAGGHAYHCYCSPEELEAEREEMKAQKLAPKYSGRCRHLTQAQKDAYEAEGRVPTTRFRVPEGQEIVVEDQVRGRVVFESDGIGDFVIVKSDGMPTYNLAVALDDHMMKITDVIRGEEHLSNTPRQILIYQALGLEMPTFAHVSLILDENRQKMSKRNETIIQFIEQYRELGYLPEGLVNFIVLLGWSPEGEEEIFSMDQLIEQFSLDRVAKNPAVFDMAKLNWMCNHYMKDAGVDVALELALPHLRAAGYVGEVISPDRQEWLELLVELYLDRMSAGADLPGLVSMFFDEAISYDDEARAILDGESTTVVVAEFVKLLEASSVFTPESIKDLLKEVQQNTGHKGKNLFMPIRVAATGSVHGPDLNKSIWLLGKDLVISRMTALL